MKFLALVRCMGVEKTDKISFKFKGVYRGKEVHKIVVQGCSINEFKRNGDYLLFAIGSKIEQNVLYAEIIKSKRLKL